MNEYKKLKENARMGFLEIIKRRDYERNRIKTINQFRKRFNDKPNGMMFWNKFNFEIFYDENDNILHFEAYDKKDGHTIWGQDPYQGEYYRKEITTIDMENDKEKNERRTKLIDDMLNVVNE